MYVILLQDDIVVVYKGITESVREELRIIVEFSDTDIDSVAYIVQGGRTVLGVCNGGDCEDGFALAVPDSKSYLESQ